MPDGAYVADSLRAQLRRGTHPEEDWFRLKVTGNGETRWLNISAEQLAAIMDAIRKLERIAEVHGL